MKRWITMILLAAYCLLAVGLYVFAPQLRDWLSPTVYCAYAPSVTVNGEMCFALPRESGVFLEDGGWAFYVAELDDTYPERSFRASMRSCRLRGESEHEVYLPYAALANGEKVIVHAEDPLRDGMRVVPSE